MVLLPDKVSPCPFVHVGCTVCPVLVYATGLNSVKWSEDVKKALQKQLVFNWG